MSLYLRQIEQLVELQKVDDQIHAVRKDLTNAPKEIEDMKAGFKKLEEERAKADETLNHLREQEKRLNFDIADDEIKIKRSQTKYMQASNAKEYNAGMREVDSLEKQNLNRKSEKLLMAEELTHKENILEEINTRYTRIENELAEKEAGLPDRLEKARNMLKELDDRRREAGKDISMPVLSRYEFIRERLAYPVIVPVVSGICSGCNISIPPQGYIELQKGKQILSCPNCQRLIYWNEHFTPVQSEAKD
ncbi:MAG: C4-type zinc ribbon domain-containing protein [Deltaproteobacteria bacterium]|nr:C4-type zinc ribbon domain-containing protein [Deltaproteobacteria bacterium]